MMLAPDLLDRRALALLRLLDVFGRPVTEPVLIQGDGLAFVRKKDGFLALLEAPGLKAVAAGFLAPSAPAAGSMRLALDLEPQSAELAPRRFELSLPRDTDPAKADQPESVFRAVDIEILPGPRVRLAGSACALRVSVRRKGDKMLIENALVRARSEDQLFTARGLTDARGEAILMFPSLPLAFPGAGANLRPDLEVRVVVTVDPGSAKFNSLPDIPRAIRSAPPFPDPDALGSAAADFASGTLVTIAAGREVPLAIEWTQP